MATIRTVFVTRGAVLSNRDKRLSQSFKRVGHVVASVAADFEVDSANLHIA